MTADIRTAAQREAVKRTIAPNIEDPLPGDHQTVGWRLGFVHGAEWAENRVTPTREQLAERIAGKYFAEHLPGVGEHTEVSVPLARSIADIVGDLMAGLAEGEK